MRLNLFVVFLLCSILSSKARPLVCVDFVTWERAQEMISVLFSLAPLLLQREALCPLFCFFD